MAALTSDQLVYLHDHVGAGADEADLQVRYDRTGDLDAVIVEVLRRRLADFAADPAQFSVSGEYSQNTSENIRLLQAKLGEFVGGSVGGLSQVRIVRPVRAPAR